MTQINLLSRRAELSTLLYRKAGTVRRIVDLLNRDCHGPRPTITRYIDAFAALERTFYRVCGCSRRSY